MCRYIMCLVCFVMSGVGNNRRQFDVEILKLLVAAELCMDHPRS